MSGHSVTHLAELTVSDPVQRRFCTVQHNFPLLHVTPATKDSHGKRKTHTHTHTHTQMICSMQDRAPITLETQQHTLALGQESSLSQQPSPSSTTRQLFKRKNHLNNTDKTAWLTAMQKSLGAWGNILHPL